MSHDRVKHSHPTLIRPAFCPSCPIKCRKGDRRHKADKARRCSGCSPKLQLSACTCAIATRSHPFSGCFGYLRILSTGKCVSHAGSRQPGCYYGNGHLSSQPWHAHDGVFRGSKARMVDDCKYLTPSQNLLLLIPSSDVCVLSILESSSCGMGQVDSPLFRANF